MSSTFADAFDAWKQAEQDALAVPSATTRQAAQQAHFALTHHPAAHRARGQIQRAELDRRGRSR